MFRFSIVCLLIALNGDLFSQTQIPGLYDPQRKTYIANANLLAGGGSSVYDIDGFKYGLGIVEVRDTRMNGVIDSTGAVRVPFIYRKLNSVSPQLGMFSFESDDYTGVVNNLGQEILKIEKGIYKTAIRGCSNPNMVFVENEERIGLFNMAKGKMIVPMEYDKNPWYAETYVRTRRPGYHIDVKDQSAIAKKGNDLFIFNLSTGQSSPAFSDVLRLSSKLFFVKNKEGQARIIDLDFQQYKKIPGTIIDAHVDVVLSMVDGKYGVYDVDGEEKISPIYDDLYLINKDVAWVKKGDFWAMCTYENEIKTPFEFTEIEKINDLFLANLLWVTKMDTTENNLRIEREYAGINEKPNELKMLIYAVQEMKGSKRLFNCYLDRAGGANRSFAKKADGYHFTYPPLQNVDTDAWDMVYYVPSCIDPSGMQGYKKDNKYGTNPDAVKYESILYDALEMTISCECGCVISRGMVMSYAVDYAGNKNCIYKKTIPYVDYTLK